jgi:hypothetical protein
VTRTLVALLALVLTGGVTAGADDWPAPRVFTVWSESGRVFVRFSPGDSVGDTAGFSGAPRGKYATAVLYALQSDRSYRLQQEVTLANPVLPLAALVADDGRLITFDNWHNVGFGKVVAIYAPDGKLVRAWELTDLYAKDKLDNIPRSVGSRYWRCARVHFVDPKGQHEVYVPEALGGYFVFTLANGKVAHTPGTRTQCQRPETPMSSSTLGR